VLDLKFEMETARRRRRLRSHGHPLPEATLKLAKRPTPCCSAPSATGSTTSWTARCAPSRPSWACARTWACSPTSAPPSATSSSRTPPASSPSWWPGLDILIIRELTGDIYFGQPRGRRTAVDGHFPGAEEAFDTMRYTRPGDRAHRPRRLPGRAQAQQAGHQRGQGQRAGDLPVLEGRGHRGRPAVPRRGARPHVRGQRRHAAGQGAQAFDVVVTGNMFGDILSDEAAMLTGSIGMLPSASLNAAARACTSPATAARRTSPARAWPIRWPPSCRCHDAALLAQPARGRRPHRGRGQGVLAQGLRTADIHSPKAPPRSARARWATPLWLPSPKTITKG
jgi:3-isopropylmalate dehydrogenase